jgi:hypothetical protein
MGGTDSWVSTAERSYGPSATIACGTAAVGTNCCGWLKYLSAASTPMIAGTADDGDCDEDDADCDEDDDAGTVD